MTSPRSHAAHEAALIDAAARRYDGAGRFDRTFVRRKLRGDPMYLSILARGLLPDSGLLLDLGCGRGIFLALVAAARQREIQGSWPRDWSKPPVGLRLHGIEGRSRMVAIARSALGDEARVDKHDLTDCPIPRCDAVLLLDVLHYFEAREQSDLLLRVSKALEGSGRLLIREADAGGGARFLATRLQERWTAWARGERRCRFHFRTAEQWSGLLASLGLTTRVEPMHEGTPFSNILIEARRSET